MFGFDVKSVNPGGFADKAGQGCPQKQESKLMVNVAQCLYKSAHIWR